MVFMKSSNKNYEVNYHNTYSLFHKYISFLDKALKMVQISRDLPPLLRFIHSSANKLFGPGRLAWTFAIIVAAVVVSLITFSLLLTNERRRPLWTEQPMFVDNVYEPRMCIRKTSSWNGSASTLSNSIFMCLVRETCDGCKCFDPRTRINRRKRKLYASVLEDASDLRPNDSSIFFAETSCNTTQPLRRKETVGRVVLSPWQACAVEAAARLHPRRMVYLLVAAPFPILRDTKLWSPSARALLYYSNIQIAHLTMKRYVKGSPLEDAFAAGALARGPWPTDHASLMVMYLTLWRFGGTFFDIHFVPTRSINDLHNFAILQNSEFVGSEALSFSCDALGRRVAEECVRELRETFNCRHWHYNGPGVITRVLQRMCPDKHPWTIGVEPDDCQGFEVLPAFSLNPEHRPKQLTNQQPTPTSALPQNIISKIRPIFRPTSKKMPRKHESYRTVARRLCPHVVASENPMI